jgi:hypothetical protein
MAMISDVLSNCTPVQTLAIAEVVNYLQQNHWQPISHPNPRLLVFENGVDDAGKPIQIVLPSQDSYEDKPYLLTKAVNLLSVLQSTSFQAIVNAIAANTQTIA